MDTRLSISRVWGEDRIMQSLPLPSTLLRQYTMTRMQKNLIHALLIVIILLGVVIPSGSAAGVVEHPHRWSIRSYTDEMNGTYVDWDWYMDDREIELIQYYRYLHDLTGWNIPLSEFIKTVSPEDYETMPEPIKSSQARPMFGDGHVAMFGDGHNTQAGVWLYDPGYHMWTSPEGYVYNGDLPPYQWLVWKGWEEYADCLPTAPAGAPFPAPSYAGTPRNTLPIAKIDLDEQDRVYDDYSDDLMTMEEYYELLVPIPDAIYVNPNNMGDWDWTAELKSALSRLGLDANIANTRLGYEKSGDTITMVGMTPAKVMMEWTLTKSNGDWTCDTAKADDLDDLLFILEKIGAISGSASSSPVKFDKEAVKCRLSGRLDAASRSSSGTNIILQEMLRSRTGTTSSAVITKPSGIEVPESETSTKPGDVTVHREDWDERVSQFTAGKTSASTAESIAQAVQSSSTRSDIISQAITRG